jgi:hypothetical protein
MTGAAAQPVTSTRVEPYAGVATSRRRGETVIPLHTT